MNQKFNKWHLGAFCVVINFAAWQMVMITIGVLSVLISPLLDVRSGDMLFPAIKRAFSYDIVVEVMAISVYSGMVMGVACTIPAIMFGVYKFNQLSNQRG